MTSISETKTGAPFIGPLLPDPARDDEFTADPGGAGGVFGAEWLLRSDAPVVRRSPHPQRGDPSMQDGDRRLQKRGRADRALEDAMARLTGTSAARPGDGTSDMTRDDPAGADFAEGPTAGNAAESDGHDPAAGRDMDDHDATATAGAHPATGASPPGLGSNQPIPESGKTGAASSEDAVADDEPHADPAGSESRSPAAAMMQAERAGSAGPPPPCQRQRRGPKLRPL